MKNGKTGTNTKMKEEKSGRKERKNEGRTSISQGRKGWRDGRNAGKTSKSSKNEVRMEALA